MESHYTDVTLLGIYIALFLVNIEQSCVFIEKDNLSFKKENNSFVEKRYNVFVEKKNHTENRTTE